MPKFLSIAMTVMGVLLLGLASFAGDSMNSGFSQLIQGTPDTSTIVLLILGILLFIVGITNAMQENRS